VPRIFISASLFAVRLFGVTLAGLALHPEPPARGKPLFQGAQIDEPTLALFQRACQNCHSENTQWPWYSLIPPASWMIAKDVNDAHSYVNFSNWSSYRLGQTRGVSRADRRQCETPAGCRCRVIRCSIAKQFSRHRSASKSTNGPERRENACAQLRAGPRRPRSTHVSPCRRTSNRCESGSERQPS
jgi:hypothetical protein